MRRVNVGENKVLRIPLEQVTDNTWKVKRKRNNTWKKEKNGAYVPAYIEKNGLREMRNARKESNMKDAAIECILLVLHFGQFYPGETH